MPADVRETSARMAVAMTTVFFARREGRLEDEVECGAMVWTVRWQLRVSEIDVKLRTGCWWTEDRRL